MFKKKNHRPMKNTVLDVRDIVRKDAEYKYLCKKYGMLKLRVFKN